MVKEFRKTWLNDPSALNDFNRYHRSQVLNKELKLILIRKGRASELI